MRLGSIAITLVATAASALLFSVYTTVIWPWFLLGWIGWLPWLVALDRLTTIRAAAAAGLLMAIAFSLAVFPWFPAMLADYSGLSPAPATVVFILLAPWIQPQFIAFAVARAMAASRTTRRWILAVVGAGAYVGTEWAAGKLLGDTVGQGQFGSSWIRQSADLFGAHGLTYLLFVFNEGILALAYALSRRAPAASGSSAGGALAPLVFCVLLLAAVNGYGIVRLSQWAPDEDAPVLRVALVQANIGHYDRLRQEVGTFEAVRRVLAAHFTLSAEAIAAGDVDLVVWPETVYPTTFGSPKSEDGAAFDREIAGFVDRHRVPLLFGAFDRDDSGEFNAAIHLEPSRSGRVEFDVYRKARLFPFTEYLPRVLESERVRRWLPWAGTWTPGEGARVLAAHRRDGAVTHIAPLICYDAIDPMMAIEAVRRGAEVLVTMSNDSWFAYAGAREVILVASSFRGIETRRPQVRSTPTGISAVIDATGQLVDIIEADRSGTLTAAVTPTRSSPTLMVAWGEWFPPTALAAAVFALLWAAFSFRGSENNSDT